MNQKINHCPNAIIKSFFSVSFLFQIAWFCAIPFSALAYQSSSQQLKIQVDKQKINILVKNYPLGKLLQSIHEKTGIQFKVPEPLNVVPVNAKVFAKDWKSTIKKLFEGNSRFEMWGKNLKDSKVWLYEYEDYPVSSGDFVVLVDAKETLSKREILRLAKKATEVNQRLMAMEHFSYLADDEETIPMLVFNLQANNAKIRAASLTLFKNLAEPIPLNNIGAISQSDNDQVIRMQALSLIAERGNEEDAKPYLLQALNDPSQKTRNLARELLNDLGLSDT
jgi:hypothetical protein